MPKTFLLFPAITTSEFYQIYKNIFILCNDSKKAESELCKKSLDSKIKWYKSNQQKRSIPDEIKFLHSEDEEKSEENRLFSIISYTWGTITLKDKLDPENDDPFNSDKTLEKLYMYYRYNSPHMNWIVLRTESEFTSDGG